MTDELFHRADAQLQTHDVSSESQARIRDCAALLSRNFNEGLGLMLDGDAVLVEQDSLFHPKLTDPNIITAIRTIESKRIPVGLATARAENFVEFLRAHGLIISGPLILQEGQVLYVENRKTYFVSEKYREFIIAVRRVLSKHPKWKKDWATVWSSSEAVFCNGNSQWQGDCRISFWFYDKNGTHNSQLLQQVLDPVISEVAQTYGLHPGQNYVTSLGRMSLQRYVQNGDLGILSIRAVRDGVPIDKSVAAAQLGKPSIVVADGYKDATLGLLNKALGGINIGINGNLDKSEDAEEYMKVTDFRLASPRELSASLVVAAKALI